MKMNITKEGDVVLDEKVRLIEKRRISDGLPCLSWTIQRGHGIQRHQPLLDIIMFCNPFGDL